MKVRLVSETEHEKVLLFQEVQFDTKLGSLDDRGTLDYWVRLSVTEVPDSFEVVISTSSQQRFIYSEFRSPDIIACPDGGHC